MTSIVKNSNIHQQRGVAALVAVVVISAAALIIAWNASMTGLGELESGYASQKGSEAMSIAEGCIDETFRRIRLDTSFGLSGSVQLLLANGSCIIQVVDLGSNTRRITATAQTNTNYYKKIETTVILAGNVITLMGWEEKTN